jgi:hypothetical protein
VKAGLVPETKESLTFHVHAHLDVFKDGAPVEVPAGIGIDISNPGVQHGLAPDGSDLYGGIAGCDKPCISPLHTHDITGVLHTESKTPQPNTLGQFFTEWGVKLTAECVGTFCAPATPIAFYVDGKPFTGDPATILLEDHLEIAITIGSPAGRAFVSGVPDTGTRWARRQDFGGTRRARVANVSTPTATITAPIAMPNPRISKPPVHSIA